jgi:hypothetical protein
MFDEIVESGVEAPGQSSGYPRHTLEGAIHPCGSGVDVVEAPPGAEACDRDGAHERTIDGHAEPRRFVDIDDEPSLHGAVLEVPLEQPPEDIRLEGASKRQEESNRPERAQRASGDAIACDPQRLRRQRLSALRPAGICELGSRFLR